MPNQDKRLYPLTSYSIGIWRTPEKTKAYLLVLDKAEAGNRSGRLKTEQKRFVVLVTREAATRVGQNEPGLSVNWMLGWLRHQVSLRFRYKNPFIDHTQQPGMDTSVLTFEISWSNIVGVDFKWPLTDDPRLVLEAAVVSKRVFDSVEDVCLYYQAQPRSSKSPRLSLNRLAANEQQTQLQSAAPEAPAAGPANSQLNNHQHPPLACEGRQPQQQLGVSISRVSSWASWSSLTSAPRLSAEHPHTAVATALEATTAAAAAASKAPAGSGVDSVCAPAAAGASCKPGSQQLHHQQQCTLWTEDPVQPQRQQQPGRAGGSQANVREPDHQSCGQAWPVAVDSIGQQQQQHHSRTCSCSSTGGVPCSLSSAPTLSAGIAAMGACIPADADAAAAASAVLDSISFEGFGECPTPPNTQQPGRSKQQGLSSLSICTGSASLPSAADRPESSCSGSGSPVRTIKTAAAAEPAMGNHGRVAQAPAFTQPLRQLQLLAAIPAGYATAPCSAPSSPKVCLGSRTGSGFFTQALSAEESQQQQAQLLQDLQQPLQQLRAQQLQRQRYQRKSRYAPDRSSKQRTQACPLCNQPLLQPLDVLQQRFHQQQESRHRRTGSRGVGKSRSACSLEQLMQQENATNSRSGQRGQSPLQLEQQAQQQVEAADGSAAAMPGGASSNHKQNDAPGSCSSGAGSPVSASSPLKSTAAAAEVDCNSCSKAKPVTPQIQQEICEDLGAGSGVELQGCAHSHGAAISADGTPLDAVAAIPAAAGGFASAVQAVGTVQLSQQEATLGHQPATAGGMTGAVGSNQQVQLQEQQYGEQQESVYRTRTVIMTFKDPTLPHKLREFVNSDVRLLKLYESGLPGWAIMLPSYGLYYRPMLRRVTWLLFVLLSVVSMAMGFYDLYKNVPYFKQVMVAMFRPAAGLFEWLEGHTQIRLSILLTYMLGRTQILVQLIKFLTHTSLQPILGPIASALAPLTSALSATAATAVWALQPVISAGKALASPISMLAQLVWLLLQLLWQLLSLLLWSGPLQLLQAVAAAVTGLLQLLLIPVQLLLPTGASIRAGWTAAKGAGQVARSAVPVVKSSAVAASSSWPTLAWYPLEALELMRVSTLRVMRALQAVVKFFVTLGSTVNQHRLSLMLQLRQQLRGGLRAAADSPAGRVASAVAVKMGQEQRVQRLHRRLHQTDSIVSLGSEALGHADSAVVGTALSLDRELSAMSLNGGYEEYSIRERDPRAAAAARGDADSDDEVSSALAEVSGPLPAELHSSAGGLRHRATMGPVNGTRFAQYAAAASSPKQVSFTDAGAVLEDSTRLLHQLPAHALRRSVDVVTAGSSPVFWSAGGVGGTNADVATGRRLATAPSGREAFVGSLDSAGQYFSNNRAWLQLRLPAAGGIHGPARPRFGADVLVAGNPQGVQSERNGTRPVSGGVQPSMSPGAAVLAATQAVAAAGRWRRNSWG